MQGKRIFLGLTGQILAEFVNKVVPLVILHYVIVRIGAEAYGFAQFGMSILDLAIPFVVLGYAHVASVDIGKHKDDTQAIAKIISETIALRLFGAAIVAVVLLSFVMISSDYREYFPIILALTFVLFTSAVEMHFVHVGSGRMVSLSVIVILLKLLILGAILYLVHEPEDATLYAVLSVGANGLIAVMTFIYNFKRYPLSLPSWRSLVGRFTKSLPFALLYFWSVAWLTFDLVIAEHFFGRDGAAMYGANLRMVAAVVNLLNAVCLVFFSEVVGSKSREELSKLVNISILAVFMISLPVAVGAWFTSKEIILLVLSPEFLDQYMVFNLLFTGIVAHSVIIIIGYHLLLYRNKASLQNWFMGLALFATALLAILGGHQFGLTGIALGSLTGRLMAAIGLILLARKFLDSLWYWEWTKIALATLAMGLALLVLASENLYLNLVVGVLIYGSLLGMMFKTKFRHYMELAKKSR
jgi:O-antigen/teichoic acid export membrane protein